MKFDLPAIERMIAHYSTLQGLAAEGWAFTCEIVPGLKHNGEDAWAVVDSDPKTKTAHVKVRDLAKTPIPAADPWYELNVTVSHEMWHPWVTLLLAEPTVENEEALVEAAAQAVVRSAGAEARVMARSVRAIPDAVRARVAKKVSARANVRARGGTMDPKMVQAALDALIEEGQGESKSAGILRQIIATLAAKGAGGDGAAPVEPDGDEGAGAPVGAREENQDMAEKNKPGGDAPPAARPMARSVDTDHEATRARKAADSLNASAIRARLHTAKIVDGLDISPALEKEILGERDIDGAEKLLRVVALAKGDGTRARSESGARPAGAPPPAAASKYDVAKLIGEGINPIMAKSIADEKDPAAADLAYNAARARIVNSKSPWPTRGGAA